MGKKTKEIFLLEALKILVDGIAETFGARCEVVLHDLRNPHRSIIKIANGHVTGRHVGSPITDYVLKLLSSKTENNLFLNYSTTANDGRLLKSSSFLFRDENNNPFAALCINFDVTDILSFNKIVEDIFETRTENMSDEPIETFQSDISSMLTGAIDNMVKETGKSIPAMKKEDRKKIVTELHSQGFFRIKSSVKLLSQKLGVSKFTIYSYLDSIKSENKSNYSKSAKSKTPNQI